MRGKLPRRLQLATISDGLRNSFVRSCGAGDLSEGQLKPDQREALQDGCIPVEGQGLGCTLRIQVFVPSEFGVVPRIAKLTSGK